MIDLRLGDCLEILPTLKTQSIDAVIIDPPFFAPASHYQSRISWGRSWADLSILGQFFFELTNHFKRILKEDGHLFVFCNDESYPVFYPAAYGLWDFTAALVWDKTRVGLGKTFRHQYELILWASNSGAYADGNGTLHSDILRYAPTLSAERYHPVEKPPQLMQELMRVCTKEGATVLDCFMGAGATGIAAHKENRNFIGVEMNKDYFETAQQRIKDVQAQMVMPL